ncbi:histidinol phosphatase [Rhizobium rhizosphaerae]|uniref:Histidinol phosphatase n=1 Tax=Xaviernesmea rhizosphaerae TaxID=1672749 RepID=A0A1Q9ANM1_9HYPH|nr:ABC transporter ATP-binding protein [Xaviernesmea rhizosphaerae]OLP56999.1 histidinol phosphatase [Xaviernesmea rhizosphaerae]
MSFAAENICWKIRSKTVLDGVSFTVRPGEMLGLLGPNGSGKTSLLRLMAGLKRPHAGRVTLEGEDLQAIARRRVAQRVAFVEQHATTNASLMVEDVVRLGRFPHRGLFSSWSGEDEACVEHALAHAGMAHKRRDRWQTLSGGERQRAHIARALAQSPRELILDEPTNHLDVQHQMALLALIARLPITSIIALHDLNHAALFCDRLVVLKEGRVVAEGTPEAVLTEALMRSVFQVEARIAPSLYHGRPHIQFLPG